MALTELQIRKANPKKQQYKLYDEGAYFWSFARRAGSFGGSNTGTAERSNRFRSGNI